MFNYFYNNEPISKSQFEVAVGKDWQSKGSPNEYGEYSFGYYRAVPRD